MGKAQRQKVSPRKRKGIARYVGWAVVAVVIGLAGYGLTQMSGVAFDEDDIKVVNFQGLSSKQRQSALGLPTRRAVRAAAALGLRSVCRPTRTARFVKAISTGSTGCCAPL